MKLCLDTASIEEIREINRWGVLGGVTTNPSLLQKEAAEPDKVWRQILEEVAGDVSLEVTAPDADEMVAQGRTLAAMGPNAVVKVPMTPDGLEAGTRLVSEGVRINVTLVFSPAQAILAAEAGAYIVSPFLGRVDATRSSRPPPTEEVRRLATARRPGDPGPPRRRSAKRPHLDATTVDPPRMTTTAPGRKAASGPTAWTVSVQARATTAARTTSAAKATIAARATIAEGATTGATGNAPRDRAGKVPRMAASAIAGADRLVRNAAVRVRSGRSATSRIGSRSSRALRPAPGSWTSSRRGTVSCAPPATFRVRRTSTCRCPTSAGTSSARATP